MYIYQVFKNKKVDQFEHMKTFVDQDKAIAYLNSEVINGHIKTIKVEDGKDDAKKTSYRDS